MNWRLVFGLSLFGIAMAFATTSFIHSSAEPFFWLPVFIICAVLIAVYAPGRYFLHGFLVSMLNYTWIAIIHSNMYAAYMAHDAKVAELYTKMNKDGLSAVQAICMTSIIFGVISGIFIGLFSTIASKFVKR